MNKKLFTVKELAKLLNVSRVTIFNRIQKGQIKAEKIGRDYIIKTEDLNGVLYEDLTCKLKEEIKKGVERVVLEYGEVLKKLGKE